MTSITTSSSSAADTPDAKPPRPPHGWARARCCSRWTWGKMASMSCNPAVGGVAKRSDCQRDRCIGRSDGPHHRPNDRPVPDAQSFERRRDVESPGAMRQNPLLGGVAAYAGKHPKPLYLAGCGDRTAVRRRPAHGFLTTGHPGRRSKPEPGQPPVRRANAPYHGGPDPHGRRIHLPRRRAHLGNFPRRTDALGSFAHAEGGRAGTPLRTESPSAFAESVSKADA